MLTKIGRVFKILFITYVYFNSCTLAAQEYDDKDARKALDNKEYRQALEIYDELLKIYPADHDYHYYAGKCRYYLNDNIPRAIEHLKLASSQFVPTDVYYYLGRCYHLNYQFDEAIENYNYFKDFSSRSEWKSRKINDLTDMAKNGKRLIRREARVSVINKDTLHRQDIPFYYNTNVLQSGKLINYYEKFYIDYDMYGDSNSYIFKPASLAKGDYLYISGTTKGKNKDLDVLRLQKIDITSFKNPENLGLLINSNADENYVWYDRKNQILYYSSKGHNSMGGYDIFMTHYDESQDDWSSPKNMGFPVNSPYDDYLMIPKVESDHLCFITHRGVHKDSAVVVEIEPGYLFVNHTEVPPGYPELNAIGKLSKKTLKTDDKPVIKEAATIKKSIPAQPETEAEYNKVISKALNLQLKSDSLMRVAEEVKDIIDEETEKQERAKLFAKYNKLEEQSKEIKRLADEQFEIAMEYEETLNNNANQTTYNEDKNIVDELKARNKKKKTVKEKKKDKKTPDSNPQSFENELKSPSKGFMLHESTKYSSRNPIPIDAPLPGGLVYKIQLGVYSQPAANDFFGGITPVTGEKLETRELWKYYAGQFNHYEAAYKALQEVRAQGFSDAFIVSWFKGGKVSINRAQDIEKTLAE